MVTTLAGSPGQAGSADGTNNNARFNNPSGVATDSAGNMYVADTGNCTLRKVTANGVVTTLAGSPGQAGSADGTNNNARFNNPSGVAVDSAGTIFVADAGNDTIREVTSNGVVTTLAGSPGQSGSADGTNNSAQFNHPAGVAAAGTTILYVADAGNQTIRQVTRNGVVTTLAGSPGQAGTADGTNGAARFLYPFGVAADDADNVGVADTGASTLREITVGGVVTTLAGSPGQPGAADGTGTAARFLGPTGVTADGAGNWYVADNGNSTIRKVTAGGVVTTLAGAAGQAGSADITGSAARYFSPRSVAVDDAGNVYVADTYNCTIRKVTSDGGVTTLAGSVGQAGSADGTNSSAQFNHPFGVAVDNLGNVYVADTYNSTIRLVTSNGVVTTLAGSAGQLGSADGTGAEAQFNYPSSLAVDDAGNVYVADTYNCTIRKVTAAGKVTTLAGSAGQPGSADGTGGTAQFEEPNGVTVDLAGNLYVADSGNNLVRKLTGGGKVTTLAGSAGIPGSADGTNSAARFDFPYGLAVDIAGNVYVADAGNNTIRKVTSAGAVTTIGGTAGVIGGADGIGGAANFAGPSGVAVDDSGRIYVADAGNNRITTGAPLPGLNVTRFATGVIVSWPAPFTNFVLQENADLGNASGWSTAVNTINDDGTNRSIAISPPAGTQFFRLRAN